MPDRNERYLARNEFKAKFEEVKLEELVNSGDLALREERDEEPSRQEISMYFWYDQSTYNQFYLWLLYQFYFGWCSRQN